MDTYDNAVSHCDALFFAGKTDWRVPTIKELSTLVDTSKGIPAIDTILFPETLPTFYWSSTLYAPNPTAGAMYITFDLGSGVFGGNKTNLMYFRCVSGPAEGTTSFTDNGNGTVTDSATNLIWQKCSNGQNTTDCTGTATTVTWANAITYCNGLSLASKTWRLPNRNELQSIVDYTVFNPSINTTAFPSTLFDSSYWSSTSLTLYANVGIFVYGSVGSAQKSFLRYVRCVSGP